MRTSLNNSDASASPAEPLAPQAPHRSRLRTFLARFGVGAVLFFTIKGLIWLAIGGGVAAWASR